MSSAFNTPTLRALKLSFVGVTGYFTPVESSTYTSIESTEYESGASVPKENRSIVSFAVAMSTSSAGVTFICINCDSSGSNPCGAAQSSKFSSQEETKAMSAHPYNSFFSIVVSF